jgi:hypothetical protein
MLLRFLPGATQGRWRAVLAGKADDTYSRTDELRGRRTRGENRPAEQRQRAGGRFGIIGFPGWNGVEAQTGMRAGVLFLEGDRRGCRRDGPQAVRGAADSRVEREMTIVAGVKSRDGLILAADSMTTVTVGTPRGPQFIKAYEHGRKLFHMGELPIGAVTYGLGNIGTRSMEGLVLEACKQMDSDVTDVEAVAQALYDHLRTEYDAAFDGLGHEQKPACGFLIGGYSADEPLARLMEFEFPDAEGPTENLGPEDFGATWRGIDWPFTRLWRGFAPSMVARLQNEDGIAEARIGELVDPLEIGLAYEGMPVQDAINFATYILDTTIGAVRFAPGVAPCGGPLQLAAVIPDDGFRWVAKPELHMPPIHQHA